MLIFTDDALVALDKTEYEFRNQIGKCFAVKKESIGLSSRRFGDIARKCLLCNVAEAQSFSSSQFSRAFADGVESFLKKKGLSFSKSRDSPLLTSCRPELDATPKLSINDASHYQSLIGILKWIVDLVRVEVLLEFF